MKQKYFVFIALFTTWLQYGQEAFYTPDLNDNSYIEDTYLLTDNNEESATGVEWIDEMYEEYFEGENSTTEISDFIENTFLVPGLINCPSNISVFVDAGICGAVINFTEPTSTISGNNVIRTVGYDPGEVFPGAVPCVGNTGDCHGRAVQYSTEAPRQ